MLIVTCGALLVACNKVVAYNSIQSGIKYKLIHYRYLWYDKLPDDASRDRVHVFSPFFHTRLVNGTFGSSDGAPRRRSRKLE